MTRLLNHPLVKPLLLDEHFSVDGTLIERGRTRIPALGTDGSGDGDPDWMAYEAYHATSQHESW
jgi:hypothetical protein